MGTAENCGNCGKEIERVNWSNGPGWRHVGSRRSVCAHLYATPAATVHNTAQAAEGLPALPGPYAVRLNDLVDALRRGERDAQERWRDAKSDSVRMLYASAGTAMELLRRALLNDPATDPPARAAKSAKLVCTCEQVDVGTSEDQPGTVFITGARDPECKYHGRCDSTINRPGGASRCDRMRHATGLHRDENGNQW